MLLAQAPEDLVRVAAPCPYFGACGGCTLQDVAYPDQLRRKRQRLRDVLERVTGRRPDLEIIGLEDPWRYRNRAEFTFGQADGRLVLGYHVARSFWKVVDLDDCLLLPLAAMAAARAVHRWAVRGGFPAYRPRTHEGWLRHLVVRASRATGRVLLCLVTAPGAREPIEELAQEVMAGQPEVSSVFWGVSDRVADVAQPQALSLVRGDAYLEEQVGPLRLRVGAFSFLQSSTQLAPRLYEYVRAAAAGDAGSVMWDLYCGVGVVGLYLAPVARHVYGIDSEPQHLELARWNAQANGARNMDFRMGRAEALLLERRFWLVEGKPQVVVVDPPRSGLHQQTIASLLAARPRRLIYVSCNAQSLARDLRALLSRYPRYRLTAARAFDLFPQTDHVETVAVLDRLP